MTLVSQGEMVRRTIIIWPLLAYTFKAQAFLSSVLHHDYQTKCSQYWLHDSTNYQPEGYENAESYNGWARRGLFLSSSLVSTLEKSIQAKKFLLSSLLLSIASHHGFNEQHLLRTTPSDTSTMTKQDDDECAQLRSFVSQLPMVYLRILYIPTAMYALQSDSTSTEGTQRQRARADGKKRRDAIVQYIEQLKVLGKEDVQILAITLDLDDGSLKQPHGSNDRTMFPENGHDAFQNWNPNLIYLEGGNTFWLYHCIRKGKWMTDIHSACSGATDGDSAQLESFAVFVGKSAGAIVGGNKIETACWKGWDDPSVVPGMSKREDWKLVSGMKMAGVASFFPHMTAEWGNVVNRNTQDWDDCQVKNLILLHDDDVLLVDGQQRLVTLAPQNH